MLSEISPLAPRKRIKIQSNYEVESLSHWIAHELPSLQQEDLHPMLLHKGCTVPMVDDFSSSGYSHLEVQLGDYPVDPASSPLKKILRQRKRLHKDTRLIEQVQELQSRLSKTEAEVTTLRADIELIKAKAEAKAKAAQQATDKLMIALDKAVIDKSKLSASLARVADSLKRLKSSAIYIDAKILLSMLQPVRPELVTAASSIIYKRNAQAHANNVYNLNETLEVIESDPSYSTISIFVPEMKSALKAYIEFECKKLYNTFEAAVEANSWLNIQEINLQN